MLSHSLEFNPYFRYPAKNLIQSSYFDDVRDLELEKNPIGKVELPFDATKNLSISDFYKFMKKEIALI